MWLFEMIDDPNSALPRKVAEQAEVLVDRLVVPFDGVERLTPWQVDLVSAFVWILHILKDKYDHKIDLIHNWTPTQINLIRLIKSDHSSFPTHRTFSS